MMVMLMPMAVLTVRVMMVKAGVTREMVRVMTGMVRTMLTVTMMMMPVTNPYVPFMCTSSIFSVLWLASANDIIRW